VKRRSPRVASACLALAAALTGRAASATGAVAPAPPATKELPVDRPDCRDRSSDAFFFPGGWLGYTIPRYDQDQALRRWYSKALQAMAEPSLSCPRKGGDALRFLWLRSFARPIAVRVESSNGGAIISAVELSGAGGYEPRKVSRRFQRQLTDAERLRLSAAMDGLRFFEMPTQGGDGGPDGARWVLEGRMGARYHVVDRWSPKDGAFREFCLSLLKLADWLPPEGGKGGVY
jgi:hypothetical protein